VDELGGKAFLSDGSWNEPDKFLDMSLASGSFIRSVALRVGTAIDSFSIPIEPNSRGYVDESFSPDK
jgi:hypothetical protein